MKGFAARWFHGTFTAKECSAGQHMVIRDWPAQSMVLNCIELLKSSRMRLNWQGCRDMNLLMNQRIRRLPPKQAIGGEI